MTNRILGFFLTQDEQRQADESLCNETKALKRGDEEEVRRQLEFRAQLLDEANKRAKRKADTG